VAGTRSFDLIEEAGRQWREHWGEDMVASMMAVTSVMRVQQLLLAQLNERLERFGLTFARYEALMLLYFSRNRSLPLGKIGARLQVHPTSVTNLVDGLQKAGYVRREPHPTDRRTVLAALLDRGVEVAEQATHALHEIGFGLTALDQARLRALTEILTAARAQAGDFDRPTDSQRRRR
jgi:DNA-binding MarR family transcriptional regulator